MRQRVYVSGPYSSDPEHNTHLAIEAGQTLLEFGYAPMVPHLNHYWDEYRDERKLPRNEEDAWLALDLAWVAQADAVIRLPGESQGADRETNLAYEWGIPVYMGQDPVAEFLKNPPPRSGDPRFHQILRQLGLLHDKKQQDYGTTEDPLANIRASEAWGIPAWVGALIREHDKTKRLQKFAQEGKLANEPAEDAFMDKAVYAVLGLILYREVTR